MIDKPTRLHRCAFSHLIGIVFGDEAVYVETDYVKFNKRFPETSNILDKYFTHREGYTTAVPCGTCGLFDYFDAADAFRRERSKQNLLLRILINFSPFLSQKQVKYWRNALLQRGITCESPAHETVRALTDALEEFIGRVQGSAVRDFEVIGGVRSRRAYGVSGEEQRFMQQTREERAVKLKEMLEYASEHPAEAKC